MFCSETMIYITKEVFKFYSRKYRHFQEFYKLCNIFHMHAPPKKAVLRNPWVTFICFASKILLSGKKVSCFLKKKFKPLFRNVS